MAFQALRIDALQSQAQNLIINGNFDFWQRGTSVSMTTSQLFQADRFSASRSATWTGTYARQTDAPSLAQSSFNSQYSLKITNGTGASPGSTDTFRIRYSMEGNDYQLLHSAQARLQFWVKSSITGTFPICFKNYNEDRTYVSHYTISAANTWEKKFIDLTFDTTGTYSFDNTGSLIIDWSLACGSGSATSTLNTWQAGNFKGSTTQTNWAGTTGATFQLAQVSLIPGDFVSGGPTNVDMPFRRAGRAISDELRMCQRYYETSYNAGIAPGSISGLGAGIWTRGTVGTGSGYANPTFTVKKRAAPTIVFYKPDTGGSGLVTRVDATGVPVDSGTPSATIGDGSFYASVSLSAGTAGYYFHWTADADL